MSKHARLRWYVGVMPPLWGERAGPRTGRLFSSRVEPTKTLFPQYWYVVGPFQTLTGARYFIETPACGTVEEAERAAHGRTPHAAL